MPGGIVAPRFVPRPHLRPPVQNLNPQTPVYSGDDATTNVLNTNDVKISPLKKLNGNPIRDLYAKA